MSALQVRNQQRASRRQRPQEQNLKRVRRTSSRRSAYAFAHQEGYGELITSGKNMKAVGPSSAPPAGGIQNSSSWIENLLKKRNDVTSVISEPQSNSTEINGTDKTKTEPHKD